LHPASQEEARLDFHSTQSVVLPSPPKQMGQQVNRLPSLGTAAAPRARTGRTRGRSTRGVGGTPAPALGAARECEATGFEAETC